MSKIVIRWQLYGFVFTEFNITLLFLQNLPINVSTFLSEKYVFQLVPLFIAIILGENLSVASENLELPICCEIVRILVHKSPLDGY